MIQSSGHSGCGHVLLFGNAAHNEPASTATDPRSDTGGKRFRRGPSLLYGVGRDGVPDTWRYGVQATRAVATVVSPGRPDMFAGAATHFAISVAFGQALGRLLPTRRSTLWGAGAGAAMGLIGAGIIGRRSPTFRRLPFGRQLADNVAFGIIFALVADRPAVRPIGEPCPPTRNGSQR